MQEYVNELVGTCLTIEELLDTDFLNFLDDQIFLYGWWKPIEELSERVCIEGDE